MPSIATAGSAPAGAADTTQFPAITRDHILHCSYDYWFPKYRTSCIKSRIIQLPPEFVEYIREDGIVLADDDSAEPEDDDWQATPSQFTRPHVVEELQDDDDESSESDADEIPQTPPNLRFPAVHQEIKDKIADLGGAVAPKLNWTAPKDATWISPHQNTIKCTTPNDIYLLLKSSNFITYDLEHAFDDCVNPPNSSSTSSAAITPFKPVLALRSYFNPHTAMEFRCFVKHRNLIAITQRDLSYYEFLRDLRADIVGRISQLFNHKLRYTFPEGNFVFDVYIPESSADEIDEGLGPLSRARLIDINAWAPHTDSLLFDWGELLATKVPGLLLGMAGEDDAASGAEEGAAAATAAGVDRGNSEVDGDDDSEEDEDYVPELRLIEKEDPSAYNFSAPQYSAHKLPKDVVDASLAGEGGMREFAQKWKEMTEYRANVADWEMQ